MAGIKQAAAMPDIVFARNRSIEIEANLLLAGLLVINVPKGKPLEAPQRQAVQTIVEELARQAREGLLPDTGMVHLWIDEPPADAGETVTPDMADMMGAWADAHTIIAVRVPRDGDSQENSAPRHFQ